MQISKSLVETTVLGVLLSFVCLLLFFFYLQVFSMAPNNTVVYNSQSSFFLYSGNGSEACLNAMLHIGSRGPQSLFYKVVGLNGVYGLRVRSVAELGLLFRGGRE